MEVNIQHRPGSSAAQCILTSGETLTAEGGSMICMSGDMDIKTTTHKRKSGNILKAATRLLSGEGLFLNHYSAPAGGEVWLAPTLAGDMIVHELSGSSLIVQSGSYLASDESVEIDFSWQGMKSFLSGESIFWLNINGTGKVILNAFGAIYPLEVDGEMIVDTGHIVAFDPGLSFEITKAGKSWLHSYLGGEGFVCRFKGKGTVWCQSHNPGSFGSTLGPSLKSK